mmetsp:Transcript_29921/g.75376  ORF Transcript_29921/g.75376 Transcript_29921/m.75376 type:complete len:99 (+) Transcript_29921:129-425(+)
MDLVPRTKALQRGPGARRDGAHVDPARGAALDLEAQCHVLGAGDDVPQHAAAAGRAAERSNFLQALSLPMRRCRGPRLESHFTSMPLGMRRPHAFHLS